MCKNPCRGRGKRRKRVQGGQRLWCLCSRAVMFPLVSSRVLMLEWIGLDMPKDSTSLSMHSQQISTTCILSTVVAALPLSSTTPKCENVSLLGEYVGRKTTQREIQLIDTLFERPGAHKSDGYCSRDRGTSVSHSGTEEPANGFISY